MLYACLRITLLLTECKSAQPTKDLIVVFCVKGFTSEGNFLD